MFKNIFIFIIIISLGFIFPAYADSQKVLRVGVDYDLPPYSFFDNRSDSIRGFNVDLIKMLAASLRSRIKFFRLDSDQLEKQLIEGKIDLIIREKATNKPNLQSLELPIKLERKLFVNNYCVTVTCVRDLPGRKVAIVKGNDLTYLIPAKEKVEFIQVETHEKAVEMVNSGVAEVFFSASGFSAIYSIQKNNLRNIKEVGLPIESVPLAIWVRQEDTPLLTELSVAFGKITENKNYDTIYHKWFGQNIPFAGLEKYIKIIIGVAGCFALTLLSFFIWNQMLKKKVREVTYDLKLSEQRHKDLIEFSPEMIHLVAPNGQVVHANKIALQTLQYSREEILSRTIFDLVPLESREKIQDFIDAIFQKGLGEKEFSLLSKDGKRIDVEMSATLVRDINTFVACCFSRDITERKRLETELMQSERLALMGEMAVGIAHEINNPLGIILANTEEMLHEVKNQGNIGESLETIERNALRAAKFIDDLLTFTRPTPPAKVQIDLLALIEESLSLCKQQLKQKGIAVDRDFPREPVIFEGDDSQIQQLIVNLILNSVQAIHGKGTIRISVNRKRDNGADKVHLMIADTGIGIPEKDLPKIFDPFYTARKNKGFGLGLSISKRIVEKHNGTIRVKSEVGQGTTFFVEMPAHLHPTQASEHCLDP